MTCQLAAVFSSILAVSSAQAQDLDSSSFVQPLNPPAIERQVASVAPRHLKRFVQKKSQHRQTVARSDIEASEKNR